MLLKFCENLVRSGFVIAYKLTKSITNHKIWKHFWNATAFPVAKQILHLCRKEDILIKTFIFKSWNMSSSLKNSSVNILLICTNFNNYLKFLKFITSHVQHVKLNITCSFQVLETSMHFLFIYMWYFVKSSGSWRFLIRPFIRHLLIIALEDLINIIFPVLLHIDRITSPSYCRCFGCTSMMPISNLQHPKGSVCENTSDCREVVLSDKSL